MSSGQLLLQPVNLPAVHVVVVSVCFAFPVQLAQLLGSEVDGLIQPLHRSERMVFGGMVVLRRVPFTTSFTRQKDLVWREVIQAVWTEVNLFPRYGCRCRCLDRGDRRCGRNTSLSSMWS